MADETLAAALAALHRVGFPNDVLWMIRDLVACRYHFLYYHDGAIRKVIFRREDGYQWEVAAANNWAFFTEEGTLRLAAYDPIAGSVAFYSVSDADINRTIGGPPLNFFQHEELKGTTTDDTNVMIISIDCYMVVRRPGIARIAVFVRERGQWHLITDSQELAIHRIRCPAHRSIYTEYICYDCIELHDLIDAHLSLTDGSNFIVTSDGNLWREGDHFYRLPVSGGVRTKSRYEFPIAIPPANDAASEVKIRALGTFSM